MNDSQATAIWLDYWSYARALLLGGDPIPWKQSVELLDFYQKSLGLLRPSVAAIPLDLVVEDYVRSSPELREAMAKRSRSGYAAKVALADEGVRAALHRIIDVIEPTSKGKPLAFACPGPRHWLKSLHLVAHGSELEEAGIEGDERVAAYLADFLGALAETGARYLLLLDRAGLAEDPRFAETIAPLLNAAKHLRWQAVLVSPIPVPPETVQGAFDKVCLPGGQGGKTGHWVPSAYWTGEAAELPAGGALYSEIPEDADPEMVLAQREALDA